MRLDEIGKNLERLRKESGIRPKDVLDITTYSFTHVREIERTNQKMSVQSLCNLLDAYGYEIEFKKKGDPS